MKLKIISDLHTEWFGYQTNHKKAQFKEILNQVFPEQEHDKECVLVCAGDMGKFHNSYDNSLKLLFSEFSKRFKNVIFTSGNHEYYGSTGIWGREHEFWPQKAKLPDNVSFLDIDYKIIDDVMFIGACLWTNCDRRDPLTMYHIEKGMNDYKAISTEGLVRLTTEDTVERYDISVGFLRGALHWARDNGFKPVVVTHHAPSSKSVHTKYRGDILNHAFYSDLDWLMEDFEIPLWVHGHTHNSFDYTLGETRVICNPFGYIGTLDQNVEFNTDLVVEV